MACEPRRRFEAAALPIALGVLLLGSANGRAEGPTPLRLVQVIPLPGVEKRIDHLAVDLRGQRLFVAALGNGSLEIVDLGLGQRVRSVPGLKEPQGVVYLPELRRVVVANAGGTLVAFDDGSLRAGATLPDLEDADDLRSDAATGRLYVGYGDGALGIVDPESLRRLGDIELPGHPESFQLERDGPLAYVNVPRTREVVVVDRVQRRIVSRLPLGSFAANFPMALDETRHRLFLGTRSPARLLVVDVRSGAIAAVACVGDADDLFYDPERGRVYVTGGEGFVDVFDARVGGGIERLARVPSAPGARTSLWVPELHRLFVAAPRRSGHEAALYVYEASG